MTGVYVVEDILTEDQFLDITRGVPLTLGEMEALKKYYKLPYDEGVVVGLGVWQGYAARAWQKIRGCPLSG